MSTTTFKLEDLASAAAVSPRTVRYYVQRGLLPAPAFRGRDTAYTDDHLLRLRAIRKLQDQFLPLDAIQAELARLDTPGLRALADGHVVMPAPRPWVPSVPAPRLPAGERMTRVELEPGLELTLSDGADARVRALFEQLCDQHMKGSGR